MKQEENFCVGLTMDEILKSADVAVVTDSLRKKELWPTL